MKVEVYLEQKVWDQSTSVYIVGTDQNGKTFRGLPVTIKFETILVDDLASPMEPTFSFNGKMGVEFLKALHDGLVRAGFKDKDYSAEATKLHLDDMRKLVFDTHKIIMKDYEWKTP